MLTIILLFLNVYSVFTTSNVEESDCPKSCHPLVEEKINIHLIPHSHDDVGWLKTYDEYYNGTGKFDTIANAGVKYILDSTIPALNKNHDRRFIQVETAFFWKWWNDQSEETRNLVKELVNRGQLEMINGGWSMNDEATTNYQSVIDQFTWGFRILEETLGECGRPKIGWQIDPFGHSREHAYIVKQLGFEALVIGRIDYRDKEQRIKDKNLDFFWNTNDNFDETDANIFTTIFPNFYTYEEGFCFDVYCNDTVLTDDNLKEKVAEFKIILDKYTDYYKTKNIMIPMGHDFSYQKADKNFDNIDKLIEGFKNHSKYNVIYSTPYCYVEAVQQSKPDLTIKTDDFFPHATDEHSFWTGFYTSRPTSKRFERIGNNILQCAKQLTTFSRIRGNNDDDNILKLRMAMGIMQHHDAITGTEKQAVADDYSLMINEGIRDAEKPISNIIRDLLKKNDNVSINFNLSTCLLANVSICETSTKERFVVVVYNPLSRVISHYVRIPVDSQNYKITGPEEDGDVSFDILDTMHRFDFMKIGVKPVGHELLFLARNLPPLGIKLYYFEKLKGTSENYYQYENLTNDRSFGSQTNNKFTIGEDGKLESVTLQGHQLKIKQEFFYYKSYVDDNSEPSKRSSGAYIFRPNGDAIRVTNNITEVKFVKGNLADEVLQVINNELTQVIRMYKGDNDVYLEFDWLVGDLDMDDKGKEVVTRFIIDDFDHDETFYTDSNGRQQIKRIRNKRSTFDYNSLEEPVSSNYYPVTSKIVIKSNNFSVTILNDRAQGGSSLEEGQIELMIHRREKHDDDFGVDEILNEMQYGKGLYVRGQHYLTFATLEDSSAIEKDLASRKLLSPWVLLSDATYDDLTLVNIQKLLNFQFAGLTNSLPNNVQILTLEPWKDSYILRLEHIFEKKEDTDLSNETTINLMNLFTLFNITKIVPVTLGGNENLITDDIVVRTEEPDSDLSIRLRPMEIKTFIFVTDKINVGGHYDGIKRNTSGNQHSNSMTGLMLLFMISSNLLF